MMTIVKTEYREFKRGRTWVKCPELTEVTEISGEYFRILIDSIPLYNSQGSKATARKMWTPAGFMMTELVLVDPWRTTRVTMHFEFKAVTA